MGEGNLIGFTDNFADNSTEAGFQFTFYCDICREGYKTRFTESKTYKKGRFFKGLGSMVSAAAQMTGKYNIGYGIERGTDVIGEKFKGMSPAWQKEHEEAFELAQNEAKEHFHRCPKCTKWVCENDWNEQEGLCTVCAPRINVEVAAAKAEKAVSDIKEKAAKTQVFTGKIESKQTICPQCGKPAGEGKFCSNCGAPLALIKCSKCGAENPAGTRFCGECGTKLE
ncbi:zinc ribbon domain-containing protein [Candidatus Oleimmundimicrobium sp.]|uniref:zinc ribbon domain-containing protein n=1 Tax=Candidatus Oleimmundimicrobium sp. TaxID=3060597 RepID=UPI00271AAC93|nr:zinc ribbon domain-containing protein [Candidatus Oleimmundimicrobium sp.]MDO8886759.1 zinc ribbon domain-containing protein [Candidatus Oleimmundimicrobium sp.]